MDIASASVGLVPVGATTGSYIAIEKTPHPRFVPNRQRRFGTKGAGISRVFFMVGASCDPAWVSQTEIGKKNDMLEEAVFQCQVQIFNSPGLSCGSFGFLLYKPE